MDQAKPKLITMAMFGRANEVEALLQTGVDVNTKDKYGTTALMYATNHDNPKKRHKVVQLLLNHKADVNAQNRDGFNALIIAINNYSFDTAKVLLDLDANVNARDKKGKTALMHATDGQLDKEAMEVIKIIIKKKLAKNSDIQNDIDYQWAQSLNRDDITCLFEQGQLDEIQDIQENDITTL